MNKAPIYFLKSQVTLTMGFKLFIRKINLLVILLLVYLSNNNAFSEIIYDKNNILISNIELNQYQKLYFQKNKENLNEVNAIKQLVLLKKTIKRLEINEPEVIDNLDKIIFEEYGEEVLSNKIKLDFIRYLKIRNEFIIEYYNNKLNLNGFKKLFNSFSKFNVPISNNNCLTIYKVVNLKDDEDFIENLYLSFVNEKKDIQISFEETKYNACISDKDYKFIENQLIKYIELNTLDEFEKFIYEY